jgi:hypothetical protein
MPARMLLLVVLAHGAGARVALAGVEPHNPFPDADVYVTRSVAREGVAYSYVVENRHPSEQIGALMVGYNIASGETSLETLPRTVSGPRGWSGRTDHCEECGFSVRWSVNAGANSRRRAAMVPARQRKAGFTVVVPREAPEYLTAWFTVYLSNGTTAIGPVKAHVETVPARDRAQGTLELRVRSTERRPVRCPPRSPSGSGKSATLRGH